MSAPGGNGTASAPLARNDFREGQVLRARDLERESGYFLARDRQHAALAHIPGILRGLRLQVFERGTENLLAPESLAGKKDVTPLDVFLEAGVAVDGFGRLVGVPRRDQLRPTLATSPSLLPEGRYRVELLYDRVIEGGGGRQGADPCAGGLGGGESRIVRERHRLQLVAADQPLREPGIGPVLDGPPDAPEAESPVALGTVDWNGVDAFVGFSLQGRVYAGIHAGNVLSPDERAEVDLRDPGGRVAVRFAPEAAAGESPELADAVRIDSGGSVWVRDDVDVGPDGVSFRPQRDSQVRSNWHVALRDQAGGSPFGMKPGERPDEEAEVGPPPEYAPGERELRIVFERTDDRTRRTGRRRVVIGHVSREGGEASFLPAVIVYDRPPHADELGASTVEVWGDLFVRGTAYLTTAQRVEPGKTPQAGIRDDLDLLLRQLAGPMADALRAFLLGDPDWLSKLGDVVSQRPGFMERIFEALRTNPAFIHSIAEEATAGVETALLADEDLVIGLLPQLLEERFIHQVSAALAAEMKSDRVLASAVVGAMTDGTAAGDALLTAVLSRVAADPGLADRAADLVVDRVAQADRDFAKRLTKAQIELFKNDSGLRSAFKAALA